MSVFRFGLQKVLELREQAEQEQARALADAQRQAQQAQRQLEQVRMIREAESEKLLRAHTEGQPVGHLRNLSTVIAQIGERVRRAEAAVQEAEKAVESSRVDLVEAMTQRRVIDQLKERKLEAWQLERKETEQKQTDELALERFQRRSAQNGGTA